MKYIYLIGFRGTGFNDEDFASEAALIRAGHVGLAFEGEDKRIFGFHQTLEASQHIGDDKAVIEWLKEHNTLPGTVQDDPAIFMRAHILAQQGTRTQVWYKAIAVEDQAFEEALRQMIQWYTDQTTFTYAFPVRGEVSPDERDNCATFPRHLGLTLPEETGQLVKYIAALEQDGKEWKPEER